MHATAWFDGACLGNPGPMGAGAVVVCNATEKVVSNPLGRGTNNEAEYEAVIAALQTALDLGATSITLHGDSQLVLRQLEGRYAVKAAHLIPLHARAVALLKRLRPAKFAWIPREQNTRADELAKAAAERRSR